MGERGIMDPADDSEEVDRCGNCRFWEQDGEIDGECHRRCPTIVFGQMNIAHDTNINCDAIWPLTMSHEWCGDHQRREDPR